MSISPINLRSSEKVNASISCLIFGGLKCFSMYCLRSCVWRCCSNWSSFIFSILSPPFHISRKIIKKISAPTAGGVNSPHRSTPYKAQKERYLYHSNCSNASRISFSVVIVYKFVVVIWSCPRICWIVVNGVIFLTK